jgi:hypothetical protein
MALLPEKLRGFKPQQSVTLMKETPRFAAWRRPEIGRE